MSLEDVARIIGLMSLDKFVFTCIHHATIKKKSEKISTYLEKPGPIYPALASRYLVSVISVKTHQGDEEGIAYINVN